MKVVVMSKMRLILFSYIDISSAEKHRARARRSISATLAVLHDEESSDLKLVWSLRLLKKELRVFHTSSDEPESA